MKVSENLFLPPKRKFQDVFSWMNVGFCLLPIAYVALFRYKKDKKVLLVNINKCMDLTSKDKNVSTSDPYVKLQLLPDKEHKVKTRVLRKTRNPVYDEDFTFFGIQTNKLQVRTKTTTVITTGFNVDPGDRRGILKKIITCFLFFLVHDSALCCAELRPLF